MGTGQPESTGGKGNHEDEGEEDEDKDEEDAGRVAPSVTMLAMVEEAVCEYARAFVGTKVRVGAKCAPVLVPCAGAW